MNLAFRLIFFCVSLLISTPQSTGHRHLFRLTSDDSFTVTIPVEAWRKGSDKDGRHYTILIFAKNEAGTASSMNLQAVVPHDQRKK